MPGLLCFLFATAPFPVPPQEARLLEMEFYEEASGGSNLCLGPVEQDFGAAVDVLRCRTRPDGLFDLDGDWKASQLAGDTYVSRAGDAHDAAHLLVTQVEPEDVYRVSLMERVGDVGWNLRDSVEFQERPEIAGSAVWVGLDDGVAVMTMRDLELTTSKLEGVARPTDLYVAGSMVALLFREDANQGRAEVWDLEERARVASSAAGTLFGLPANQALSESVTYNISHFEDRHLLVSASIAPRGDEDLRGLLIELRADAGSLIAEPVAVSSLEETWGTRSAWEHMGREGDLDIYLVDRRSPSRALAVVARQGEGAAVHIEEVYPLQDTSKSFVFESGSIHFEVVTGGREGDGIARTHPIFDAAPGGMDEPSSGARTQRPQETKLVSDGLINLVDLVGTEELLSSCTSWAETTVCVSQLLREGSEGAIGVSARGLIIHTSSTTKFVSNEDIRPSIAFLDDRLHFLSVDSERNLRGHTGKLCGNARLCEIQSWPVCVGDECRGIDVQLFGDPIGGSLLLKYSNQRSGGSDLVLFSRRGFAPAAAGETSFNTDYWIRSNGAGFVGLASPDRLWHVSLGENGQARFSQWWMPWEGAGFDGFDGVFPGPTGFSCGAASRSLLCEASSDSGFFQLIEGGDSRPVWFGGTSASSEYGWVPGTSLVWLKDGDRDSVGSFSEALLEGNSLPRDPIYGTGVVLWPRSQSTFEVFRVVESAGVAVCGNGRREEGEACDDGNRLSGDGCEACRLMPLCGNAVLEEEEECDDGNVVAGDGCGSVCEIEETSSPTPPGEGSTPPVDDDEEGTGGSLGMVDGGCSSSSPSLPVVLVLLGFIVLLRRWRSVT